MSAHTHWLAIEQFDGDESLGLVIQAGDEIIARMPGIGQHDFDNAQRIAAAPDLLAALIEANKETQLYDGHAGRWADLITKATGGAAA